MSTPTVQIRCALYARVSTLLKGQDAENQLIHLRRFAGSRGLAIHQEYTDKGTSGAKERRPALDALVRDARSGKFKVIVIAALDRLARDTRHLLNLFEELRGYGVTVISLRENLDFSSAIGAATLAILGAVSALERQLISERTASAIAARKLAAEKAGVAWRCGRPPLSQALIEQVIRLREQGLSIRAIERSLDRKVSKASIGRILKERSVSVKVES